ncbi:hypothetical protein M2191_002008 [Bradyrhizobium japonicum]|nr:hypothetical protein [Bradyrhizobium japonicum]
MRHVAADETAGESDADPQILRGTRRKDARQPRHCPIRTSREHLLHVYAKMDRIPGSAVAEFVTLRHGPVLKSHLQL